MLEPVESSHKHFDELFVEHEVSIERLRNRPTTVVEGNICGSSCGVEKRLIQFPVFIHGYRRCRSCGTCGATVLSI